ncbi:LysR family transcriptional regulator [Methylobacterium platani]|uniref:LysR family transcriptional regulator n=2 Tax=Methylobacterium platani TaxID=427683 RepID=A0A179S6B1_9HYPH|nr:LysR family transcriptional regulator [Methylobacterium platani]KMO13747.1 LysR family transcriptional regulator [Methylobacterium platani JCM 14648]OAS20912.1 LysR family transcriptional regulator [Methylobacterium platani]
MAHPQVLRDMALFVEVAKRKSFSQAAAALDVPISSLSRRITQFETSIGLRLLDRTTRKLVLTPHGEAYYEQATRLVEEAQRTFDELIAQAKGPSGLLKIAAPPDPWVVRHLSAVAAEFSHRHAQVRVHLDLWPQLVDLAQEGYDLALAVGAPRETSMITRKVGQLENGLFAAPAYLDREGRPEAPAALAKHRAVVIGPPTASSAWALERDEEAVSVTVGSPVSSNSQGMARRFALSGQGIALLQAIDVEEDVDAGRLERVLPEWQGTPSPVFIVTTSRLLPAKTRSFIAFASRRLAEQLMPRGLALDEAELAELFDLQEA